MEYTEVNIKLSEVNPFAEIVVARLNEIDFESYSEDENGVKAYVQSHLLKEDLVCEILNDISKTTELSFTISKVKQENWNKQWESNFDPVTINDKCVIRAHFHDEIPDVDHEIIITPKMSFGTGHHETTSLIISEMFNLDFKEKSVLDMGCGTGVLAILASKLGASSLVGIDFDEWAVENSEENSMLNNVDNIDFIHGDADAIGDSKFKIILANINRNILLEDMEAYADQLIEDGLLILSGFYKTDFEVINQKAVDLGLVFVEMLEKEGWAMLLFKK